MSSYDELPDDLPIPVDDGAAVHLVDTTAPAVELNCTAKSVQDGGVVRLDQLSGRTVLFGYPMTGTPGQPLPTGWDSIPGARGCTPQACAIRDSYADFATLGARVFGVSTQTPDEQLEASTRLHLPYPLLSDRGLTLTREWELPSFSVDGRTLIRRITIFLMSGVVDGVLYPVFPPDRSAQAALAWLRDRAAPSVPNRREPIPARRAMPYPIPPPVVR